MTDPIRVNLSTNHSRELVETYAFGKNHKLGAHLRDPFQDYAEVSADGTVKIFDDGKLFQTVQVKEMDINSKDYREIYNGVAGKNLGLNLAAPPSNGPSTRASENAKPYQRPVDETYDPSDDFGKPMHRGG